jgi:hypothetical protein
MNTKQLTVLWFTAIAVAITLSSAPGAREAFRPYFVLTGIIVIAATLTYTLRPHPNARVRLLWLTVGIPVVLFVVAGLVISYVSHLPSAPRSLPAPPVRASNGEFRQVALSLVEAYRFTLSDFGKVEGWIRNKSSVPIDAVDRYFEIKNFTGDTVTSETRTVTTQITPGRASHVEFWLSSSPADNGLDNYGSKKEWSWYVRILAAGTKAADKIELLPRPEDIFDQLAQQYASPTPTATPR